MTWFWFALLAPALFALSNHIDKYLLHKGKRTSDMNLTLLVLYSTFIGVFVAPIALIVGVDPFEGLTTFQIVVIVVNGLLNVAGLLAYLRALEKDHASTVVPLFQLIPVFVLVLSYVFLGETLTLSQFIGFCIVLSGSMLLTAEYEHLGEKKFKIKKDVFGLMMLANLLAALNYVIYKWVVVESAFFPIMFWEYIGMILFGVVLLVVFKKYRNAVVQIFWKKNRSLLGINGTNELLYVGATLSVRYAAIFVPIALVNVVNGFQPVFILLFGWLFTKYIPGFISEDISRHHMIQKIIAIVIIVSGGVLINI